MVVRLIIGVMQSMVASVAKQFRDMNTQMRFFTFLAFLVGSIFSGCRTAHNVAVSSFRVIDAPAAYIRRHVDESDATTTTTTTSDSDVVAPGRMINSTPSSTGTRSVSQSRSGSTATTSSRVPATETAKAVELPTAKPVPGKPGYVLSPFDPNGGYVDVTGYKPGDKVKDPYSKKIFLVP